VDNFVDSTPRTGPGRPEKSRAWLDRAKKVNIWKPSKIKDLAALPFLQQRRRATAGLFAPQHAFCAQVKRRCKVFGEAVS
jgi:hypothetical protein